MHVVDLRRTEQAFIWDLSIPDRGPRNMVTFNRKPETLHERPRSGLRRFYKHAPMLDPDRRSAGSAVATHCKPMHCSI